MASLPNTDAASVPHRVCMIVPSYWEPIMGGAQYQAKVLLERMNERGGYDVHYLARRLPDDRHPTDHGLHRIGTSNNMWFLRDAPTLLAKLNELKPDTVYCHVGCAYVGIAAWYCRSNTTKLVWHLASDVDAEPWSLKQRKNAVLSFLDKKIMEYGLRHADTIVAQTDNQVALMEQHYGRTPEAIVRNFHPTPMEAFDKKGQQDGEKEGQLEIVWVANLKKVKQPQLFVELAQRLSALDAHFTMIGGMQLSGEAEAAFLQSVEATANLDWLGALSQDTVNQKIANAHLLVNTSSYEGFSNTFIQAWQREVPVCTLNTDPDGLLSRDKLGAFANGDFDTLVDSVAGFIADPAAREAAGTKARTYADTNHGMAAADRLISLLS